ncbi:hypothetical protein B0H11DRAFT_1723838, partial [Mycena galericulata]
DDALRTLYGAVTAVGRLVSNVGTSSKGKGNPRAGAVLAIYRGGNSARNAAYTFEGLQIQARASLFAAFMAVAESAQDQCFTICTSSQYAFRSSCYWAGDNATLGWLCFHADVLQEGVFRLRVRLALVEFRWLPSSSANVALSAARQLAADATRLGSAVSIDVRDVLTPSPRPSPP